MNSHFTIRGAGVDQPLPALTASAGFWADVDRDGLMDVLLSGATTSETITRLYRNNGDGTFRDLEAGFTPLSSAVAAWGDFDNNGELDLAVSGQNTIGRAVTQIYKNEGNGIFTNIEAVLEGVIPTIVQWLDFDNDGDIDLYISGLNQDTQTTVSMLYRNEHGTFLLQPIRPKELRQGIWGDFDGDGDLDLISRGALQRNDGDGRFRIVERSDLSTPLRLRRNLGHNRHVAARDEGRGRVGVLVVRGVGAVECEPHSPALPPEAVTAAVDELTRDRSAIRLEAANREVYLLLKEGIKVSVPESDSTPHPGPLPGRGGEGAEMGMGSLTDT